MTTPTQKQAGERAQHTPGPWRVESIHSGFDFAILSKISGLRCTVESELGMSPTGEANARLIAAAPELLEACKAFEGYYDGAPDSATRGMGEAYELARQAIAKAEGRAE